MLAPDKSYGGNLRPESTLMTDYFNLVANGHFDRQHLN
jgi:hypothetical protein